MIILRICISKCKANNKKRNWAGGYIQYRYKILRSPVIWRSNCMAFHSMLLLRTDNVKNTYYLIVRNEIFGKLRQLKTSWSIQCLLLYRSCVRWGSFYDGNIIPKNEIFFQTTATKLATFRQAKGTPFFHYFS